MTTIQHPRLRRGQAIAGLLLAVALLLPSSAWAITQLHGFYEAFAQGTKGDESWQLNMPNHYFELQALSTPWSSAEGFVKFSASSNRFRTVNAGIAPVSFQPTDDTSVHKPEVLFKEGHVKFRRDHSEIVLFSGQNRFWFSQPLLNVVDGNTLQGNNDGPRSQAVRVDFWDVNGFGGLVYYGDNTTSAFSDGEDFVVGRVHKSLAANAIRFGSTFGRKDFQEDTSDYDLTAAFDVELALGELIDPIGEALGRTTFVVEAGRNFSGWLQEDQNLRNGLQIELRDVRYDALTFKGSAHYREPNLYTGISGRQGDDDRRGYWFETWYRMPRKQVNLRWSHWRNRSFAQQEGTPASRFDQSQHEIEAYAELKGGISSWIKWRRFEGNDDPVAGSVFKNVIFELQAQNKLISVRPQVRFRDFGTRFATEGFGMDINLNVSSRWKFFGRFLNANENTESRRTYFVQARYDAWQDAEFYLEYGDGGRSDRLTENDGFVGEGPSAVDQDNERRIQLIMKMWY